MIKNFQQFYYLWEIADKSCERSHENQQTTASISTNSFTFLETLTKRNRIGIRFETDNGARHVAYLKRGDEEYSPELGWKQARAQVFC